jgi:hypothetical protein
MAMERQEAVKVLREILGECDGSLLMSCVSLSPIVPAKAKGSSFELKINCSLDDFLRKCIGAVLERHKLVMKEIANSITIYRPTT